MKITKLFLSIALVALTVSSFGRINEFSNMEFENELIMESWMASPFEAMEGDLVMENWMIAPFAGMESILGLETWMIAPFKTMDNELVLECWMITPFELENEQHNTVMMVASK
jgi:hypothetical protein